MLGKRLKAIAEMIPNSSHVIDVGCDHALLDIYLTKNKNCKCIASDVNANALNQAKKNIKKYNLENKIEIICSNGLKDIEIKEPSIVVIAGMGTHTILSILDKTKFDKIEELIISSHNDHELLRKEITKKYQILEENIVKERNIYYLLIKLKKGICNYSKYDYYLGPILKTKKDPLTKEYYQYLYNQNLNIIKHLPFHKWKKKRILKNKNKQIKKLIN